MVQDEKMPDPGASPGISRTSLYAAGAIVVVVLAIAVSAQLNLLANLPIPSGGSASIARPVAAAVNTIGPAAIVRTPVTAPAELRCPSGLTRCGADCIDTHADLFNCGSCAKVCPAVPGAERTCAGGTCAFICSHSYGQDFSDCNKNAADGCEVNLASDHDNCGTCGSACDEGDVCLMGSCKEPLTGGGGMNPLTQSPLDGLRH